MASCSWVGARLGGVANSLRLNFQQSKILTYDNWANANG
jgi:hypothetical protein